MRTPDDIHAADALDLGLIASRVQMSGPATKSKWPHFLWVGWRHMAFGKSATFGPDGPGGKREIAHSLLRGPAATERERGL
jgi:hypothetical protein